jgi:Zn-dependent alcohol dehydrogenase
VTRGVIYAEPDAAPAVEELTVDPPGPREVLVRVLACGLCHTDLQIVEAKGLNMRFPILLGHEGAGVVEEVGSDVTSVATARSAGGAMHVAAPPSSARSGGCTGPPIAPC